MAPEEWIIDAPGGRLDIFLAGRLAGMSRARIQAGIRSGSATLNGKVVRPSEVVRVGDRVAWVAPMEEPVARAEPEDLPVEILFEDADMAVVNKPAGMVVHPAPGNTHGTLVSALLHHFGPLDTGDPARPGIVHRLDKETSGLILIAKTSWAHSELSARFASREVEKTYLAVVSGRPRHTRGSIDARIGRHPVHRKKMAVRDNGRPAVTDYRVLSSSGGQSLVACEPKTGRTHQIRVHLKHLGHPVLGDPLYGHRRNFTRHLLHAWKLACIHPTNGRHLTFVAPIPEDFSSAMDPELAAALPRG
jgi:23S rRNA pseudouridine1911/1915/1917 synthase